MWGFVCEAHLRRIPLRYEPPIPDRLVFLYLASYSDLADDEPAYAALIDLTAGGAVGTFFPALLP